MVLFKDDMKKFKIILKIMFAIPCMAIALVVIFFLLTAVLQPLFYALKWLYETTPVYIIIGAVWIVVATILMICIGNFNRVKHRYSPLFRTVCYRLAEYFLLYTLLGVIVHLVCYWNSIVEPAYNQTFLSKISFSEQKYSDSLTLNNQIKVGLIQIAILSSFVLRKISDIVYYVTIPKMRFNLYLRSFYMDESIQIDKDIVAIFKRELIEIADPTTDFGNQKFGGKNLFLTTSNWKREVSYYIKRANIVFCCIGTGSGVLWEMFEHDRKIEKYVFYVNDRAILQDIINLNVPKYLNNRVGQAITRLLEVYDKAPLYFIIRGNVCYYTKDLSCIAEFMNTGTQLVGLHTLDINGEITNGDKSSDFDVYSIYKDVQRIFSTIFRPAKFATFIAAVLGIIVSVVWLIGFLGGLFMLLLGLVSLASIIFPVLDFMEMETIMRKLCLAVFCFGIGVFWLLYVFESVKE